MKKQDKILIALFILMLWMTSCATNKTVMNSQWGVHTTEHHKNGGCGWAK